MRGRAFLLLLVMTAPIAAAELRLADRIDVVGVLAREPMVVEHPSGALFVAGFGSQVTGTDWTAPPLLWRSDDGGANWRRVDVGSPEDGAQGNSDVDLAVGPDGTIYFISLGFNRSTGRGTQIAMGVSRDVGATWEWQFLSRTDLDDRPWIAVSPENVAHAVWNDGKGVRHMVSRDSGRTWLERDRVSEKGGSSHLAVGPDGLVAVRIGPLSASSNIYHEATDLIAVSRDNGNTWVHQPVPGNGSWDRPSNDPGAVLRWVEPLAWGPDGTLYHLWGEGQTVWLGWSEDFGTSWQKKTIVEYAGMAFFPYLTADGEGNLAATWFVSEDDALSARLASIRPDNEGFAIDLAEPFTPQSWEDTTEVRRPSPAGEYIPAIRLQNGDIGVVSPIQDAHEARYGFSWWIFRPVR